jgi:glutathione peroxidase-type tryparedoxin peroxidase
MPVRVSDEITTKIPPPADPQSVFDFVVLDSKKQPYDLRQHAGKAVYIMNVASKCSFTKTGYEAATELFDKYGKGDDAKLIVLAFPCNQFGSQEPGTEAEITEFACSKFSADYPIMAKIDVNGNDEEPLYTFIKNAQRGICCSKSIKWNFTGFLTDTEGVPVERFGPGTKPEVVEKRLLRIFEDDAKCRK